MNGLSGCVLMPNGGRVSLPVATDAAPAGPLAMMLADSRSEETRRAYRNDLKDFFTWQGYEGPSREAVNRFCSLPVAKLAYTLNGYKADLLDRNLSEATVNRRLAALRSLLRMARRLGYDCADPSGLVGSEKVTSYRDTRGPAISEAAKLLEAVDRSALRGKRDYAILLLLCENALRRGELHRCNVSDFDPAQFRLMILGKGKGSQKAPVTLSKASVEALGDYLAARGNPDGSAPLFTNAARFSDGEQRLSGRGLLHVVNALGIKALGRPLHPHALRHMAITAYLDATSGDVRGAQRLSRHASLLTLQRYDDNRADLQGAATNLLSTLLKEGRR